MKLHRAALVRIVHEVRHHTMLEHGALSGQCEGAAGLLADRLAEHGVESSIAWGEYLEPCPEGYPTTGHCWVEIDGLIADPTREQFGPGPLVLEPGGPGTHLYRRHHLLSQSEIAAQE